VADVLDLDGAPGRDGAVSWRVARALVGLLAGLLFFGAGYVAWGRDGRLRSVSMAALGLAAVVVLVVALVRNTAAFGEVVRHDLMLSRIAATGRGIRP